MSLVTGTVTLSLAEVDGLRDKIKQAEDKVTNLEKDLQQVKSESRVFKVTKEKPVVPNINPSHELRHLFQEWVMKRTKPYIYNDYTPFHDEYEQLRKWIRNSLIFPQYEKVISEEFINMPEVESKMLEKLDGQLRLEITQLKEDQKHFEDKINALKAVHTEELVQESNKNSKKEKSFMEEIMKLKQDYKDLQENKYRLSREEELMKEIDELQRKLEKSKSKTFIQRLLNL